MTPRFYPATCFPVICLLLVGALSTLKAQVPDSNEPCKKPRIPSSAVDQTYFSSPLDLYFKIASQIYSGMFPWEYCFDLTIAKPLRDAGFVTKEFAGYRPMASRPDVNVLHIIYSVNDAPEVLKQKNKGESIDNVLMRPITVVRSMNDAAGHKTHATWFISQGLKGKENNDFYQAYITLEYELEKNEVKELSVWVLKSSDAFLVNRIGY